MRSSNAFNAVFRPSSLRAAVDLFSVYVGSVYLYLVYILSRYFQYIAIEDDKVGAITLSQHAGILEAHDMGACRRI